MVDRRKCTMECTGVVTDVKKRGGDCPWIACVRYAVDDVPYELRESLAVKMEAIRLGPIPIGQKKSLVLGNLSSGDTVRVAYDPLKPKRAYLVGNDGLINC